MAVGESQGTVLITGGTDGLGRAAAVLLAERGYRVFAAGRSAERRAQLEEYARQGGLPLETAELDVTDDASVSRALDEVRAKAGPIDVLINSAGVGYYAVVEELRMEDLRRQFETNFFGAVRMTQHVLPEMRRRRRGRVLQMSSIAGKVAPPLFGAYSASKHALEGLTDALRLEMFPFGVHVVLIEPGYIRTGFQGAATELSADYVAGAETSPYREVYKGYQSRVKASREEAPDTPEDCARVVLRALRDTPPRPRYTVTRLARMISLGRRLLSDRTFDGQMIRRFGLDRAAKIIEGTPRPD